MANGCIHIISPESSQADKLAGTLSDHGHKVAVFTSVDEALSQETYIRPDMVLLDIGIGGDEGSRLLRGIRNKLASCDLPVIVLSNNVDISGIKETIQGDEIIRRTDDAEEMADKVKILLEVMHLRHDLGESNSELERLNCKLARLMDMKNRFLSLATHDIRTPVTTMKLVGDVLDKQLMPDGTRGIKRLLDILGRNLAKIEGKVEELLLISRMDFDEITLECRDIDVNTVVQDTIAGFFPGAISRGVDIDAQFGVLPRIYADPRRVAQLTTELISCSLERLDAGQYMIVETKAKGGEVSISVCDNGPVMLEGQAESLLDGLESEEPTQQTRANLFFAHRVARSHGGRISISSSLEGGTVFTAWLPEQAQGGKE